MYKHILKLYQENNYTHTSAHDIHNLHEVDG